MNAFFDKEHAPTKWSRTTRAVVLATPVHRQRSRDPNLILKPIPSELVVVDAGLGDVDDEWFSNERKPPATIYNSLFMFVPALILRGASLFPFYHVVSELNKLGPGPSLRHNSESFVRPARDPSSCLSSTTDEFYSPCSHNETPRTHRVQDQDQPGPLHAHLFHPVALQRSLMLSVYLRRCLR